MLRKFTLLFLLCVGLNGIVKAQVIDSVSIYLPYGSDTTCPGLQLTFTAIQSNDTFSTPQYHWYTDNSFTGVIIDTFYTTALVDGDSVYCWITFVNSLGALDSTKSNTIIVHRSNTIPPRVLISLTTGSNPDCSGHLLTFTAYPVNGGNTPIYHWIVNSDTVAGADSVTFTRHFNAGDTVSCLMISDSPCAFPTDSAFSFMVPILHDSLTAFDTIVATHNPICLGALDTFMATTSGMGAGYSLAWYINTNTFPSAVGPMFITDTLHDGDKVYCVLTSPDSCVINHTTVSNVLIMTVISPLDPTLSMTITEGANPGCLDSPITFTATYLNFGTAPVTTWFVNGISVATSTNTLTRTYLDGDLVTFRVREVDGGCYINDSLTTAAVLMVRDSTPVQPLISLIGDLLVANATGTYTWYYNGSIIPGATGQTYHPLVLGYYYAIKDSSNCNSMASNQLYISLLDVKSISETDVRISVYPNPASGFLNIDFNGMSANMKLDVFNITGQGVLHEDIINQSHHETDLSYLPEGNYFVVVRNEEGGKSTFKITIKK